MENVKNIIFDLGGVVIDLQREMAVKGLEKIGVKDASALLGEYSQKGPFLLVETGEMTDAELYDVIMPFCKEGTTCRDIRDAFECFLQDLPKERLKTIRELRKKGYRLFVLSNTNPIMFNHWIENAFRAEGKTINDYFDGIVVSFQERVIKPDPKIFLNLIERYSLKPEETIMLDDSEANCKAAESVGLHARRIEKEGKDSFAAVCAELLNQDPAR